MRRVTSDFEIEALKMLKNTKEFMAKYKNVTIAKEEEKTENFQWSYKVLI